MNGKKRILIIGNVLRDTYLALDENNPFETGADGESWLDLGFQGRSYNFYRQTTVYSGAAITEAILNSFPDIEATIAADWRTQGSADDGRFCRYLLCRGTEVSYLTAKQHPESHWTDPATPVDWLFVDRSAELTPEVVHRLRTFCELSATTRLAVYLPKKATTLARELAAEADLVFSEDPSVQDFLTNSSTRANAAAAESSSQTTENISRTASEPLLSDSSCHLCYISENHLELDGEKIHWHSHQIDKLTHLTAYNIIAAMIFGATLTEADLQSGSKHQGIASRNSSVTNQKPAFDDSSATDHQASARTSTILNLARLAAESAHLDKIPTFTSVKNLAAEEAADKIDITAIAHALVASGKGILAADESGGSTHAHFSALDIPDDEPHRRDYRNLLLSTPLLSDYVNGVILFDETTRQLADDGQNFVAYLTQRGIIPGVKVDQGLVDVQGTNNETISTGLDNLAERCYGYCKSGLRFAKWRAAFTIADGTPSEPVVVENCRILAEYAKICQDENIVPIVEPELVHSGYYSLEQCATTTGWILDHLFAALADREVLLPACILKVNMALAGSDWPTQSIPEEVGSATAEVLKNHVPKDLAGIVFLSGGQGVEQSTDNLQAVTNQGPYPWPVTFSFARALQTPALETWRGDNSKIPAAQAAFTARLVANTQALHKQ